MKQLLLICAVVALVGCGENRAISEWKEEKEARAKAAAAEAKGEVKTTEEEERPERPLIADPIVEKEVRLALNKPEGELTEADLEKVWSLALSRTKITDAGLKEVAKLQKLERLGLEGTKITDAGLKEVAKLQQLKILWLQDTQITDAGVTELKKALPKCEIFRDPEK